MLREHTHQSPQPADTMNTPTRDELVALAHRFFPRGLAYDDPGYFQSPEYGRYDEAWKKALGDERWAHLQTMLRNELPKIFWGGITVPYHDAAQRFAIYLNNRPRGDGFQDIVIGCVSAIAPFYFIYGVRRLFKAGNHVLPYHIFIDSLPNEMGSCSRTAAQCIEQIYNYCQFPDGYLNTPVPDISSSSMALGEMTLLNAFFTTKLDAIP